MRQKPSEKPQLQYEDACEDSEQLVHNEPGGACYDDQMCSMVSGPPSHPSITERARRVVVRPRRPHRPRQAAATQPSSPRLAKCLNALPAAFCTLATEGCFSIARSAACTQPANIGLSLVKEMLLDVSLNNQQPASCMRGSKRCLSIALSTVLTKLHASSREGIVRP